MSKNSLPRPAKGAAKFAQATRNAKLAPVKKVPTATRHRLEPKSPYVAVTSVSISATCPASCPFLGAGCYAQTGFTRFAVTKMDAAAVGYTAQDVITEEVRLIDGAFRGRPVPHDGRGRPRLLRLHVAGDVGSAAGARALAGAARRWQRRGGGTVWTYTHAWRAIPRSAFGDISVFASTETSEEARRALARGFAPERTVVALPADGRAWVEGGVRWIPCPYETRGRTCVECKLCLMSDKLHAQKAGIAFGVHGPGKRKVTVTLIQLGKKRRP